MQETSPTKKTADLGPRGTEAKTPKMFCTKGALTLMCLLVSTTLLSGSPIGYLKIFHTILSLLPFVFLVVLKKLRAVVYFFVLYLFALFVPNLLAPYLPTWFNILFMGIIAFSVDWSQLMIPGNKLLSKIILTVIIMGWRIGGRHGKVLQAQQAAPGGCWWEIPSQP